MLEWSYLRVVNANIAAGKPVAQCAELLEQMEIRKHSAVLSEKLGDLYSAQGKPSSAVFEYEQALTLDPSPLQRVRLLLTLGEKLTGLGREAEAYDAYARLLRECPDYPDKASVYKKLVPLAQRLNKPQEVEKWQAALSSSLTGPKSDNRAH
jgi:tetratricopeptide (TPR) repeat protein